ncbi:MAG: thiamine pyrophosphate-dependent dehydrogenase E1 component subunit alpha [Candidatus Atribacteria bacterium]|nr:thiamine pyrophosphate-dependent dehydrogenase E1 component subunit alpha [Candidatus Atribacteria bacterium]
MTGKDEDNQLFLEAYRKMVKIRIFETRVLYLFLQNLIRGPVHLYIGEEAVAVGVCSALRKDDYITSTHRGHGHCIAKGGDVRRMMAELLGKKTGYCKGKGGSMHITDLSIGILGANGIVGAGTPIAVGAGYALKLKKSDQIVTCFFGDAAANQGSVHEAMNMAAIWDLPVLFVCENNLYGISTGLREVTRVTDLAKRAEGYGFPGITVDGNNFFEVYETTREMVERVRSGRGPVLLEAKTYRHEGHDIGDPCVYRTKEEVEEWKRKDPIPRMEKELQYRKVLNQSEISMIRTQIEQEVDEAVEFAFASPEPAKDEVLSDLLMREG